MNILKRNQLVFTVAGAFFIAALLVSTDALGAGGDCRSSIGGRVTRSSDRGPLPQPRAPIHLANERGERLRTVPFVYIEFALYDDDDGLGQGYDQLVGKTAKSAIYSRLLLPREFLIDGQAAGSKRVREERGGVTVDYTIEWFR